MAEPARGAWTPAGLEAVGASDAGAFFYYLSGISVLVACGISLASIGNHLRNYRRPGVQRLTIRILWMVPVYAVCSFISLSYRHLADYIDTLRDLYEAFVIYVFFLLLVNYLGGERQLLRLLNERLRIHHAWPFNYCFRPMNMANGETFLFIRRGILQFVIVKPVLAVLAMWCKVAGIYREGEVSLASPAFWLSAFYNISVCWSLYCLVQFYLQCEKDLKPYRPLPKFICVKIIIFLTYWQGLLISTLVWLGVIRGSGSYSVDAVVTVIQDLLLCLEMVPIALLHSHAFPWNDIDNHKIASRLPVMIAIRDAVGCVDIVMDTYHIVKGTTFQSARAREQRQLREVTTLQWESDSDGSDASGDDFDAVDADDRFPTDDRRDASQYSPSQFTMASPRPEPSRSGRLAAWGVHRASRLLHETTSLLPTAPSLRPLLGSHTSSTRLSRDGRMPTTYYGTWTIAPPLVERFRAWDPCAWLSANDAESDVTDLAWSDAEAMPDIEHVYDEARQLVYGDYNFPVVADAAFRHPPAVHDALDRHLQDWITQTTPRTPSNPASAAFRGTASAQASAVGPSSMETDTITDADADAAPEPLTPAAARAVTAAKVAAARPLAATALSRGSVAAPSDSTAARPPHRPTAPRLKASSPSDAAAAAAAPAGTGAALLRGGDDDGGVTATLTAPTHGRSTPGRGR